MSERSRNAPETMAEAWQGFNDTVLASLGLSPTDPQYVARRDAFYAGSQAIYEILSACGDIEEMIEKSTAIGHEFRAYVQVLQSEP